ncbi:hypothetical protein F9L07_15940 [Pimelobacter simplex]|uniref:Uncharacterized protein n=1 Tax=Nocardioides simplex TaxID=2045 RepID=A0A7J5E4G2_NOCSI|nr:hypothetical protein [Pimelobacter simplex]KAB2813166.1 hypothetical protein F9L07_15940 [Pimelobacter simplex]
MISRARPLGLLLSLSVAVVALVSAPATTPATATDSTVPVLAMGPLDQRFDADDVEAELAPATNAKTPVGAALPSFFVSRKNISVDASHRLVVRLRPADVPAAFRWQDGLVNVQIHATDGKVSWYTTLSAQSVTTRGGTSRGAVTRWVDPQELRALASAASRSGRSGVSYARRAVTVEGSGALVRAVDALPPPAFAGAPAAGGPSGRMSPRVAAARCPSGGEGPHETKNLSTKLAWATIGTSYPVGKTTAWMKVASNKSNGAKYGGAIQFGGAKASLSGSQFAKGGWSKTWTGSKASRSYRKQIEYYRVKYYNYLEGPACDHVHWIPKVETGGVDQNTEGVNRPSWAKWCVKQVPGPFTRDSEEGKNYEYNAAVKIKETLGVDLGISREYSHSQSITYNIVGKNKQLCGDTTWPSVSGKMMERRR